MMLIRNFSVVLLFTVISCAKNDTGGLSVTSVVDIGRVRASDSPVNTAFSITNHSAVPVEIDEILSGCNCTVVELPQKIIRVGETKEVSTKIDLLGRKGEFSTDILVRFTSGDLRQIRITGTVIEDIWYTGQSIRFYINQGQEVVSKDFSISTVDYPDVLFEFNTDDPSIDISELSRSVHGGETRIQFRITIHCMNQSHTSSRVDLMPVNAKLPKLTIPVFYHYLSGTQKQWLTTSQINLGEIKRKEHIKVKVYGDRFFLCGVYKVQAVSQDDVITVVSHDMPSVDIGLLEVVVIVNGDKPDHHGLVRGSLILFSNNKEEAAIQINGIVVLE
ncbi:MAG: DUF1573 domain-containing protein [Thermoguttaceae bacterium]